MKQTTELLKELSEAVGVSGQEEAVRQIVYEAVKAHTDEIKVDALGNLITFKQGQGRDRLKVMVAAHMDEVGVMITHADEKGLLHFTKVGGIDDRVLPAKVVRIGERVVGQLRHNASKSRRSKRPVPPPPDDKADDEAEDRK